MAQKGLWNLAKEKFLRERGALPKEEGDVIRKYKATHEEKHIQQLAKGRCERKKKRKDGQS